MIVDSKPLYGFLSTGDKVAMYTLRVMCEDKVVFGHEKRMLLQDHFIRILSNDKEKAIALAEELCGDMGIAYRGDPQFELNEIKRQRSELKEQERIEYEREIREREERIEQHFIERVDEELFLIGKYVGRSPAEADTSYLFWLADQEVSPNKSLYDINIQIAKNYIEKNGITKPGYVGEVGEQIELELTLTDVYATRGRFPTLVFKCETGERNQVTFFSLAKAFKELNPGDQFKIVGTVKTQYEYNDMPTTVINKPKMVK